MLQRKLSMSILCLLPGLLLGRRRLARDLLKLLEKLSRSSFMLFMAANCALRWPAKAQLMDVSIRTES